MVIEEMFLKEAFEKLQEEKEMTVIEKCKFTGMAVYKDGKVKEFTGTIPDIIDYLDIKGAQIIKVFTGKDWITIGEVKIYCVPMDRKVTEKEVEKYVEEFRIEVEEELKSDFDPYSMNLCGYKTYKKFLMELKDKFGKNISLEEALVNWQKEKEDMAIKDCRFTGIAVYNYNSESHAGLSEEFTGTISHIIDYLDYSTSDFEDLLQQYLKIFTEGWVKIGKDEEITIWCEPIDREVTKAEIKKCVEEALMWNEHGGN